MAVVDIYIILLLLPWEMIVCDRGSSGQTKCSSWTM